MPRGIPLLACAGLAALLAVGCGRASLGRPSDAGLARHPASPPGGGDAGSDAFVGVGEGYQPPAFAATDLDGRPHALADYAGEVLVLHFWASWCPYCRSEIEELTALSQPEWSRKGVRVLTVSTDQDPAKLREFLAQQALPYPVIVDAESPRFIGAQYGVGGIPVTLIVGRGGRIASRLDGAGDITEAVVRALASD